MAGIMDFLKTPEGQGLLSAAFEGMATARRGQPINSLGKAGLSGLVGYGNAQERQAIDMANQAKIDEQKRRQAALASLDPNMRNAVEMGVPVTDVWKRMNPEPEKPQLVEVADPSDPTKAVKRWVVPGQTTGVDVGMGPVKTPDVPWYVRRNPDGSMSIDPVYAEFEKTKAAYGRQPAQPMAPVAYVDDKGQTIWGTITEAKGRPAANYSPTVQGAVAGAKAGATEAAKTQVEASANLPKAIANGENALRLSDELLKHPGFKQAVGASSMLGVQKIPGTEARDFMNRLDQIKGGAFLTAFETLKGGGQITEVEGKKATEAIARMDTATSEGEFRKAVADYQSVIKSAVKNAKMRAGKGSPPADIHSQAEAILRGK